MKAKLFSISLLAAGVLLASASQVRAGGYKLTILNTPTVENSFAYAINNSGQVVGISGDSTSHATIWNGATPTYLGTLGGSAGAASGINDTGQVVGSSHYTLGDTAAHATIWNGTTPTDLGTLGGNTSTAFGINNSGQVAGWSTTSDGTTHATLWNGTTPTDLNGVYINSAARAINNTGQVAGQATIDSNGTLHATIWNGTTPTDLGTLGGSYSQAFGINDSGQVVGNSLVSDGNTHATIWNGITPTDLGTLDANYAHVSWAFGINNSGQVVGTALTPIHPEIHGDEDYFPHATIWNGTTAIDLNSFLDKNGADAGWVLMNAYDINDKGQIVGDAYNPLSGTSSSVFLLTPVPEPETYALFMAGLGLMGFIARRRKNGQA